MNGNVTRKSFENAVIGILTDGTIVTLDYVFDDMNGFKGAVGSMFYRVSKNVVEESTWEDYKDYLLDSGMDESDVTDAIVDQYMSECEFPGQDQSDYGCWEDIKAECGIDSDDTLSCSGGGRCIRHGMDWKVIVSQELLDFALSYESK